MSPKTKENTELVSTFLSKDITDKLKKEADEKGLTMSSLMRMILIQHLRNDEMKEG